MVCFPDVLRKRILTNTSAKRLREKRPEVHEGSDANFGRQGTLFLPGADRRQCTLRANGCPRPRSSSHLHGPCSFLGGSGGELQRMAAAFGAQLKVRNRFWKMRRYILSPKYKPSPKPFKAPRSIPPKSLMLKHLESYETSGTYVNPLRFTI